MLSAGPRTHPPIIDPGVGGEGGQMALGTLSQLTQFSFEGDGGGGGGGWRSATGVCVVRLLSYPPLTRT